MKKYDAPVGERVETSSKKMTELADKTGKTVKANFNGVVLTSTPGKSADQIVREYKGAFDAKVVRRQK